MSLRSAGSHRALPARSLLGGNAAILKGNTGTDGMMDRLHLQRRRKLERDESAHEPSSSSADPVSILPSRRAVISSPVPRPSVLSAQSDIRSANGAVSRSTPVIFNGAHAPPCHTSAPLVVFGTRFRYLWCACAPHDSIHNQHTGDLCSEDQIRAVFFRFKLRFCRLKWKKLQ